MTTTSMQFGQQAISVVLNEGQLPAKLSTDASGNTVLLGPDGVEHSTLGSAVFTVGAGGRHSTIDSAMDAANTSFSTVVASGSNETFTAGDRIHQFTGTPFASVNWAANLYMRIPGVTPWLSVTAWNSNMLKFKYPIAVTHAAADWELAVLRKNLVLVLPGEHESAGSLPMPPNTTVAGLNRDACSLHLTVGIDFFLPSAEANDYGFANLGLSLRVGAGNQSGLDNAWLYHLKMGREYFPTQSFVEGCKIISGWDLIGLGGGDIFNPGTSLRFERNIIDGEWNGLSMPQMRSLIVRDNIIKGSTAYVGTAVHIAGQPNLLQMHQTFGTTAYAELDIICERNTIEYFNNGVDDPAVAIRFAFPPHADTRLIIRDNNIRVESSAGNTDAIGISINGVPAANLVSGNTFHLVKAGTGNAYDISTDSSANNVRLGAGNHSLLTATLTTNGTNIATL